MPPRGQTQNDPPRPLCALWLRLNPSTHKCGKFTPSLKAPALSVESTVVNSASVQRTKNFFRIIRKEERGPAAAAARAALLGASSFYRAAVGVRNTLYDWNLRRTRKVQARVISVGNLTAGGTGKTPLVEWIARWVLARGYRVAVLCRGYGQRPAPTPGDGAVSLPAGMNDEGLLLQANLEGVPVLLGPDRYQSARRALELLRPAPECFLLDDGFQHRRLERDLDLLLIDALNPFGYGHLLPRGLLREPVSNLRRADLVLLTRADQAGEAAVQSLRAQVARLAPDLPIFSCAHRMKAILQCPDLSPVGGRWLQGKRVLGFCALGNPEGFYRAVQALGAEVAGFHEFPDHHWYKQADLEALEADAARQKAEALVTTQKDAVKLYGMPPFERPLLCLRIGIEFLDGEEKLTERLMELFPEVRPRPEGLSPEELAQSVSLEGRPQEPHRPWAECWWEKEGKNQDRPNCDKAQ